MKKSLTGLLGVAVLALATVAAPAPPGAAAPVSGPDTSARANAGNIVAVTHNLSGGQYYTGRLEAIALAEQIMDNRDPDVMALQEVCESQAHKLFDDMLYLRQGNERYFVVWYGFKTQAACGGTGVLGNAVAVRMEYPIPSYFRYQLPGDTTDHGMACADFVKEDKWIRACSTHLIAGGSASDGTRLEQARSIKYSTQAWMGQGYRVLVGGDFNSAPTSDVTKALNHLTNDANPFVDADSQSKPPNATKRGTFCTGSWNEKLDYLYFSHTMTKTKQLTTQFMSNCSDHRMILGTGPLT